MFGYKHENNAKRFCVCMGVASKSRGRPTKFNPNIPFGLGGLTVPCLWAPEGLAKKRHDRSACIEGRKEMVLFNDALNTFYLRLYGVRHMVKDHSDSEKGNPLPLHRLLFPINNKGSFICTIPQTVVDHWLEREIAQWVQPMKDRSDDPSHH